MVRKNCFDGLFCFKGDEVDNICVRKLDWTSTKTKEYLNKKKMVWKRLSKKVYFFFCDSIPPASPAMSSNNKNFFDGKKKIFKSKNFIDTEYSETWEYSEGSKNFDDSECFGEENSNSSE